MTDLLITIPGKPVGKGRPRFANVGNGKMVAYTPQKTRSWEAIVRAAAQDAMGQRPRFECPIGLKITAVCEIPDSWPGWKKEAALAGQLLPTTRPDLDNCIKLLKDAWNGVCWRDDCQVVTVVARKLYGAPARLEVVLHAHEETLSAQAKRRESRG